jgi:hypothetical protein
MQNNNTQLLMVPRMLWGVLCLSTVMYYVVAGQRQIPPAGDNPLFLPFAGIAVLNLVIAYVLSDFIFKNGAEKIEGPIELKKIIPFYLPSLLFKLALAESCSVLGLVLALQSGIQSYYPFWVGSLIVMLPAFPIEEKIIAKAKRAKEKA